MRRLRHDPPTASTDAPPAVELVGVDFAYRPGGPMALAGVSLTADAGSTLGVIGPNGGGKTTLARLLLGLLRPAAGSVRLFGLPPKAAVARGNIVGYLPQRQAVPQHFPITVRQLVRTGLAGKTGLLRRPAPADLAFVETLLDRTGTRPLADRPANELSGGQLQRALIARALAPRPKLLLLDEPTVGIDAAGQRDFIRFLQELKADLNLTVVFVSHDLRAVAAISDRIACLNRTVHYHDVPQRMPAELLFRMFACDLQAMGLEGRAEAATRPAARDGAGRLTPYGG